MSSHIRHGENGMGFNPFAKSVIMPIGNNIGEYFSLAIMNSWNMKDGRIYGPSQDLRNIFTKPTNSSTTIYLAKNMKDSDLASSITQVSVDPFITPSIPEHVESRYIQRFEKEAIEEGEDYNSSEAPAYVFTEKWTPIKYSAPPIELNPQQIMALYDVKAKFETSNIVTQGIQDLIGNTADNYDILKKKRDEALKHEFDTVKYQVGVILADKAKREMFEPLTRAVCKGVNKFEESHTVDMPFMHTQRDVASRQAEVLAIPEEAARLRQAREVGIHTTQVYIDHVMNQSCSFFENPKKVMIDATRQMLGLEVIRKRPNYKMIDGYPVIGKCLMPRDIYDMLTIEYPNFLLSGYMTGNMKWGFLDMRTYGDYGQKEHIFDFHENVTYEEDLTQDTLKQKLVTDLLAENESLMKVDGHKDRVRMLNEQANLILNDKDHTDLHSLETVASTLQTKDIKIWSKYFVFENYAVVVDIDTTYETSFNTDTMPTTNTTSKGKRRNHELAYTRMGVVPMPIERIKIWWEMITGSNATLGPETRYIPSALKPLNVTLAHPELLPNERVFTSDEYALGWMNPHLFYGIEVAQALNNTLGMAYNAQAKLLPSGSRNGSLGEAEQLLMQATDLIVGDARMRYDFVRTFINDVVDGKANFDHDIGSSRRVGKKRSVSAVSTYPGYTVVATVSDGASYRSPNQLVLQHLPKYRIGCMFPSEVNTNTYFSTATLVADNQNDIIIRIGSLFKKMRKDVEDILVPISEFLSANADAMAAARNSTAVVNPDLPNLKNLQPFLEIASYSVTEERKSMKITINTDVYTEVLKDKDILGIIKANRDEMYKNKTDPEIVELIKKNCITNENLDTLASMVKQLLTNAFARGNYEGDCMKDFCEAFDKPDFLKTLILQYVCDCKIQFQTNLTDNGNASYNDVKGVLKRHRRNVFNLFAASPIFYRVKQLDENTSDSLEERINGTKNATYTYLNMIVFAENFRRIVNANFVDEAKIIAFSLMLIKLKMQTFEAMMKSGLGAVLPMDIFMHVDMPVDMIRFTPAHATNLALSGICDVDTTTVDGYLRTISPVTTLLLSNNTVSANSIGIFLPVEKPYMSQKDLHITTRGPRIALGSVLGTSGDPTDIKNLISLDIQYREDPNNPHSARDRNGNLATTEQNDLISDSKHFIEKVEEYMSTDISSTSENSDTETCRSYVLIPTTNRALAEKTYEIMGLSRSHMADVYKTQTSNLKALRHFINFFTGIENMEHHNVYASGYGSYAYMMYTENRMVLYQHSSTLFCLYTLCKRTQNVKYSLTELMLREMRDFRKFDAGIFSKAEDAVLQRANYINHIMANINLGNDKEYIRAVASNPNVADKTNSTGPMLAGNKSMIGKYGVGIPFSTYTNSEAKLIATDEAYGKHVTGRVDAANTERFGRRPATIIKDCPNKYAIISQFTSPLKNTPHLSNPHITGRSGLYSS